MDVTQQQSQQIDTKPYSLHVSVFSWLFLTHGLRFNSLRSLLCVYRALLVAVAIFSLYSVHLLLKTANEGGEHSSSFLCAPCCLNAKSKMLFSCMCSKVPVFMKSWVTKPSGCLANSPRPAPSPCRTSEVRTGLFNRKYTDSLIR